jgi:hypothetical protein
LPQPLKCSEVAFTFTVVVAVVEQPTAVAVTVYTPPFMPVTGLTIRLVLPVVVFVRPGPDHV